MLLQRHYETCRRAQATTLKITVRFFESLIRLAQAHARLMFRSIVTLDDAVSVILIMETSEANSRSSFDFGDLCNDPMKDIFTSSLNADEDFMKDKFRVLSKYGMLSLVSKNETERYPWLSDLNQTAKDILSPIKQNAVNNVEDHYGRTQPSPAKSFFGNSPNNQIEIQSNSFNHQDVVTECNKRSWKDFATDLNINNRNRVHSAD